MTIDTKWIDGIQTLDLKEKLKTYLTDGVLTFDESKEMLIAAGQGGMNAAKLADLNTILANENEIFIDPYAKSLTGYVIKGNSANAYWWGGLDDSGKSALGNLSNSSSQGNITKLVNKWFLGTDVPLPLVGGDAAAGISGDFKYSYANIAGELYNDGVSASDVNQGQAGTCFYLAALGAIANADPSWITEDFIRDNKDGTYGFRFFNVNGEKFYVTVDTNIAVDKNGNPTLANPIGNELWVSLAEKAYAQLNSQANVLLRDTEGLNSYQAVEGGLASPLKQITGLNYTYYSGAYSNMGDTFSTVTKYSKDPVTYKNEIIKLLDNGSIGWLASWVETKDINNKIELVSGHAFMLTGYDAKTDTFTLRNPWGGDGSGSFNPEFNMPLEKFWNQTCIALTDTALKNVDYTYEINSFSDNEENAVAEGDSVNFTISRSDTGTVSTLYYSVTPISTKTNENALDHPELSKIAVNFLSDTKDQNLSIPIFTDSLKEGTESFNIELYKSLDDEVPFAKSTNFIKDGNVDASNYVITGLESGKTIAEGNQVIVTIERNDAGSESTIFINTIDGTATNGDDFEELNIFEVKFKANQKVATVTIDVYTDTLKEGNESFGLNLYKYYSDSLPMVKKNVTITDAAKTKEYIYEITSDAESEENAESEGSIITFTVTRNGTGTVSTVYLKNGSESALAGTDYLDTYPESLTFEPHEDSLTFTVETLDDNQFESSELLNIELYTEQVSNEPAASAGAYVKNSSIEIYNYAITSSSADSKSAAEEGKDIIFTITRDGKGSESAIYVDTFDGSAAGENDDWSNDYESIFEQKVTFAPDEIVKTVTVKTYADSNVDEGEEDLNLGYYLYKSDVEYTDSGSAYIKDTIPDNYTYVVSSGDNKVNEGDDITFTITRDAKGTPSTVYLWTTEDTATSSDFVEIMGEPLTFASDETVKTVTIKTIVDNLSDEPVYEYLYLDVYKYFDDENSAAYGDAWIANKLNKITGTKKAETLVGTTGQDDIYGMEGNDKITGGANQDVLSGGTGNDIFIFKSITDTSPNLGDIITDFTKGDKIDLKLIDANVDLAKDQAFTKPTLGTEFSGSFTKAGQLFFDTTVHILYGNVDKDPEADFEIELSGVTKLVAGDFVL
jgi:hypothetical protein